MNLTKEESISRRIRSAAGQQTNIVKDIYLVNAQTLCIELCDNHHPSLSRCSNNIFSNNNKIIIIGGTFDSHIRTSTHLEYDDYMIRVSLYGTSQVSIHFSKEMYKMYLNILHEYETMALGFDF